MFICYFLSVIFSSRDFSVVLRRFITIDFYLQFLILYMKIFIRDLYYPSV